MSEKTGRPVAEMMGLRPAGSPISMNEYWWTYAYEIIFPSGLDRDNLLNAVNMLVTANSSGAKIKSHRSFMINFISGGSMADLTPEDKKHIAKRIKEVKEQHKNGHFSRTNNSGSVT